MGLLEKEKNTKKKAYIHKKKNLEKLNYHPKTPNSKGSLNERINIITRNVSLNLLQKSSDDEQCLRAMSKT